jgi:putative aminopeptidase FrvX
LEPDFDVELLRELTSIPAVSGHEDRMIGFLKHRLSKLVEDVQVDGIGNVIATIPGKNDGPRVMVFAHMDQVGLVVRKLGEDGFIGIDRIGGINRKALPARPVTIHTRRGPVPASIGVMAHHLTPESERYKVPDVRELYVEVGARSRSELDSLGIRVGDSITYNNTFSVMNERFIRATALDDRAGCYVLLKVVEALADAELGCSLYATFTVQEEFNVRGSEPAARAINPHAAICIDMTQASDPPDLRQENNIRLGLGPAVRLMSFHGRGTLGGLIPNPKLVELVEEEAAREKVGLQRGASTGGLTDASFLQLLHQGIPSVDIGIPALYSHSPVEMVCIDDMKQAITLVSAVVKSLTSKVDLTRGSSWPR